jgi:hypothetical protein
MAFTRYTGIHGGQRRPHVPLSSAAAPHLSRGRTKY